MSLALGSFNTSLKHFNFSHNRIGNGQLVDVILALSMHSQLENIRMNIGSNECTALSTLLRNTTKQLQTLWLGNNNIDDEGWSLWSMLLAAANWLSLALHAIQQSQAEAGRRCQLYWKCPNPTWLEELNLSFNNYGNEEAFLQMH